jgi:hypothetical protein
MLGDSILADSHKRLRGQPGRAGPPVNFMSMAMVNTTNRHSLRGDALKQRIAQLSMLRGGCLCELRSHDPR